MSATKFIHNGESYEIRLRVEGLTVEAKAFKDGRPANGYSHSVTLPVAFDFKNQTGMDAVDSLINEAKQDVYENRWEKLLEAIKQAPK